MYTKQAPAILMKKQLEHAMWIGDELPARNLAIACDAHFIRDALLGQRLLGRANHADLGNRVNAIWKERTCRFGELSKHMTGSEPALLHTRRRQRGETDDVT